MTPEDIGPYLIERAIGRGGQATVYLGRDQAGVIDPSSANALDSSAELRFSDDASHLVLRTGRGVVLAWEVRDATSSS
ncbi:MAG: hypothetical protein U0Q19_05995 [Kineosporiaceae bacterium]